MSKLLFVAPDYVSHFNPLIPFIKLALARGDEVTVAAGPSLEPLTRALGARPERLRLGEESNSGLISEGRRRKIRDSLASTRLGWVEALRSQAEERVSALLWRAEETALETARLLERIAPDVTIIVQLAYGPVAAALALGVPFATFVTGHPAQLPPPEGVYGYLEEIPAPLPRGSAEERDNLLRLCQRAQCEFTERFNTVMCAVAPEAEPVPNGLAAASKDLVLFNHPARLTKISKPFHIFLGASVRRQEATPEILEWLESRRPGDTTVYFSFGSYFSAHSDVLRKIASALAGLGVRSAFASGLTDVSELGTLPANWYVDTYLPQVAILPHCDAVVCHGGNNTVTEAFSAGAALTIAPFASDQFWNAASVASSGLGTVVDPNASSATEIARAVELALEKKPTVEILAREIALDPGPARALRALDERFLGAARIESENGRTPE